jgi:hypothetical protein
LRATLEALQVHQEPSWSAVSLQLVATPESLDGPVRAVAAAVPAKVRMLATAPAAVLAAWAAVAVTQESAAVAAALPLA